MVLGITGGTGLIGTRLSQIARTEGHEVVVFSRNPASGTGQKLWHPSSGRVDSAAFARLDVMIHLAGAGVADKRWTSARKEEIRSSRVEGTRFLVQCVAAHAPNCSTLVSGSAIGWYGADRAGGAPFTEEAFAANDFLARTCAAWEAEAMKAAPRMRVVTVRTGIALGREGGAYPQLSGPLRFGVLPILGGGAQVVSWIHVDDSARLFLHAATAGQMTGPYNGVAPVPVTHRELMHTLAQVKGGVAVRVPVPSVALRTGLGEMSTEVLKSCTVSAEKTLESGFQFKFPELRAALEDLRRQATAPNKGESPTG